MRILFWGTPEFATPPLRALIGEGLEVVGVVTQPDRPRGRSRSQLLPPPVKEVALAEGIPVLQPERPRGDEFMNAIRALEPELSVVVAYGHILRPEIIDLPPRGTINIHASLLPGLRGASPIQAAIRDGLEETGVTIMRMVQALDAGPILWQSRVPVGAEETYGELANRLSELGAQSLMEAVALLSVGAITEQPQDDARATYAPKITRDVTRVDWTKEAESVARQIRAYDPRPGAFTTHGDLEVKLFGAQGIDVVTGAAGTVLDAGLGGLTVACGDGAVRVFLVQPAGKRAMSPEEWVRGRGIAVGDRLG